MRQRSVFNALGLLLALCRVLWRYPKISLIILVLAFGNYLYQVKIARPALLYQGEPQALSTWNPKTWFRTLRNHGFIVGYSDLRGNPLWTEYALTPIPDNSPSLKRPSHFETDSRSFNRVSHDDYTKSGYDRGHSAPNYAISQLYGKSGQTDSFLMTNIVPQKPKLNRQLWQRLEEVEAKYFAPQFGKVWVITGPIFDNHIERLPSSWTVEIPDAFYKIYLTETEPPQALAFVMPQNVQGNEPLSDFVSSIDAVESQTGLDFFTELDDSIENSLEARVDSESWRLSAVNRLPSRY
jgi:endonuclease G, mitochondrial